MSAYPEVEQVKDPAARQTLQLLFDRLAALEAQTNSTPVFVAPTETVTGTGQTRVTQLANAVQDQDAVNKRTLRQVVQSMINAALKQVGISVGITARI